MEARQAVSGLLGVPANAYLSVTIITAKKQIINEAQAMHVAPSEVRWVHVWARRAAGLGQDVLGTRLCTCVGRGCHSHLGSFHLAALNSGACYMGVFRAAPLHTL